MPKKGNIPWNKGKKMPIGWVSPRKGKTHTEEVKKFISEHQKGKLRWPNGRIFSEEWKKKIGIGNKGKIVNKISINKIKKGWNGVYNEITDKRLKRKEEKAGRLRPEICDICKKYGKICFDHCHKTGEFRGWICHKCNATLGFVGDDYRILEEMINYLNKN